MNSLLADDLGKLRVEHSKAVWELSDIYIKAGQGAAKGCDAYAGVYGRSIALK